MREEYRTIWLMKKILKKENRNLIWQRRRNNPWSNQKNTLQNQKNRENFHLELFDNNTIVLYIMILATPVDHKSKDYSFLNLNFLIRLSIYLQSMRNLIYEWLLNLHWNSPAFLKKWLQDEWTVLEYLKNASKVCLTHPFNVE